MLEVCKGWVKGTFAGTRGNEKDAPIPAARLSTTSRLKSTRSGHSRSRTTWALIPHCGHCRKPGKINMISESALHAGRTASDSFTDDHKQFFTKFRAALPTHALTRPFY